MRITPVLRISIVLTTGVFAVGKNGGRPSRNRNLVADLKQCRLIIHDDNGRRGENLDVSQGGKCAEDDLRLCFGSKKQVESGQDPLEER